MTRAEGFATDDSCFLNILGLLVEKDQEGCLEKMGRRAERLVLRDMGRLWGTVALPEERIKGSVAGEVRERLNC